MIEVVDEILADNPRFRIRDNAGNIILDNITIEMITEIIQAGTKLNKVLFDSIQTDFDSITVGKYFSPTHQFVDADLENSYSPSYIPVMTSNSQSGFVASGTTSSSSNYYYLFATNKGITIKQDEYIQIQLDKQIIPRELTMQNTYGRHYKILTSLDGINFDTIIEDVDVPYDYETKVMDLSTNTKWCKYIRIQNIENLNNSSSARNFTITKAVTNQVVKNELYIPITFNKAEKQRIMIQTPAEQSASYPTQIRFENGIINVDKTLAPNQKYELFYSNNMLYLYKDLDLIPTITDRLSVKTGTISNGNVIPQTAGYSNYIYFVSLSSGGSSYTITTSSGGNYSVSTKISCSVVQSTRKVTCSISGSSATANYIEIAWK